VSDPGRHKKGKQLNSFDPIFGFLYYVELNCGADVSKKHDPSIFRIEIKRKRKCLDFKGWWSFESKARRS
jgi:hypothetical protein